MNTSKNFKIESIKAKEILNSQRKPTIEVSLKTGKGVFKASVPSGVSRGQYEAVEIETKKAIQNIENQILPALKDKEVILQDKLDELMISLDANENKSNLGANAILGVSIAASRAGAKSQNFPLWKWLADISKSEAKLPLPSVLFMEGGKHGKGNFDIQEIMAVFPAKSFSESFNTAKNVFKKLGNILKEKYGKAAISLGAEGAYTPAIKKTEEALDLLMQAAEGKQIGIILDVAASQFSEEQKKFYNLDYFRALTEKYPIIALEDPFSEEDWPGFQQITEALGDKIIIIGDDLTVTNIKRMKEAQEKRACNGIILKPNQIGTVSEAIAAAKLAKSYDWKIMVSHRGGDTQDDFISDLATAIGADFIKAGAPTKKERVVKYNRLLKIEKELCQN